MTATLIGTVLLTPHLITEVSLGQTHLNGNGHQFYYMYRWCNYKYVSVYTIGYYLCGVALGVHVKM